MTEARESGGHFWPAAAALLTAVVALLSLHHDTARIVRKRPLEFDVYPFPEKLIGLAVQRQVFADATLLPVYGSSELTQPQRNRADEFFAQRPTGFGAFLIGNPGESCLIIATKFAALGSAARGKRAVVFLSPGWFTEPELDHKGFGVNFSPLHGNVFAFQSTFSGLLKADLARRLSDYPETSGQSVSLDSALRRFVHRGYAERIIGSALFPLGALQTVVQRRMDDVRLWEWWHGPHLTRKIPDVAAGSAGVIDWPTRLLAAEQEYEGRPKVTAFSVGPLTPYDAFRESLFKDVRHPAISPDENFSRACATSKEWTDYELMLRIAAESGMRLLVICQPLNTNFARQQGLTDRVTASFYERLRRVSAGYKVGLMTFPEAETDPNFYQDSVHPSGKGWLVYDEVLDAFYHDRRLEDQSVTH